MNKYVLISGGVIILVTIVALNLVYSLDYIDYDLMRINCCGGADCTDTSYSPEDNLCHFVLCERSLPYLYDKSICVYSGKNITATVGLA